MKLPLKFISTCFLGRKSVFARSFSDFLSNRGSAVFYVLLAIAMLAMLTFAFMDSSGENTTKQNAYQISEQLYNQFNIINSAVLSCILEYPKGGGDLNGDTKIDANDNPNRPYPLTPTDANNPGGAAANNQARNMKCPGSGNSIFKGTGTVGAFLPPPPAEFNELEYFNDAANGVYVQISGTASAVAVEAINLLQNKIDTDRYVSCGTSCFRVFVKKNNLGSPTPISP